MTRDIKPGAEVIVECYDGNSYRGVLVFLEEEEPEQWTFVVKTFKSGIYNGSRSNSIGLRKAPFSILEQIEVIEENKYKITRKPTKEFFSFSYKELK